MSVVRRALRICKWVIGLAFALLVIGPGLFLTISTGVRVACPYMPDWKTVLVAICLQVAICLGFVISVMRKKIQGPIVVAMVLGAITSNAVCSAVACVLAYQEYEGTAAYRQAIGPLGGHDLNLPDPDAEVSKVEVGLLRGPQEENDPIPPLVACTNRAAIRNLLVVLRQGKKAEGHKCSSAGVICLHTETGSLEKIEFLAGHSWRHYEFRHGSGLYRVSKSTFLDALTRLGFDPQMLLSPSAEAQAAQNH